MKRASGNRCSEPDCELRVMERELRKGVRGEGGNGLCQQEIMVTEHQKFKAITTYVLPSGFAKESMHLTDDLLPQRNCGFGKRTNLT